MKQFLKTTVIVILASVFLFSAAAGVIGTAAAGTAGDVNKDGAVNNKDVTALFRYASGTVGMNVDETACDTNGDGAVNNKDVVLLFRYLSGADVEIHYGADQLTYDNVFTEWDSSVADTFKNPKQTTCTVTEEGVQLKFARSGAVDPYIVFDIAAYEQIKNKPELEGKDGAYVLLKLKATTDGYFEIFTHSPAAGDSSDTVFRADGEFHYIIVDMTETTFTKPEKLTTVRFDWGGALIPTNGEMLITEIGFFSDPESAVKYTGLKEEEVLPQRVNSAALPKDMKASDYFYAPSASFAVLTEGENSTVKVTSTKKSPRVDFYIGKLAKEYGGYFFKSHYLALRIKATGQENAGVTLTSVTDSAGLDTTTAQSAELDCTKDGWQGVIFDLRKLDTYDDVITKISVSFNSFTSTGSIEIGGIALSDHINDALTICEMQQYCLNYDENLTDNDELADKVLEADKEDDSVLMWFDHITEKTNRTTVKENGRKGYTVRMAKNESENCQFFLYTPKDIKVRVEVEDFKNENGKTVPFELYYEYYHNIENVLEADALPPLTGALEIPAECSQGFVIQLTSAFDTEAGEYNSVVHVYDDATGDEIKRGAVAVKVWDFELSDKTELRSSFLLWTNYLSDSYNWDRTEASYDEVYRNYFEFFLKYRINIIDIPNGMTSSYGSRWMEQDRVNTARWYNRDYSVTEDLGGTAPSWLDKVIYYMVDEPKTTTDFQNLKNYAEQIRQNTPDYRMVCPMDRNVDMKNDGSAAAFAEADTDQIGFMSQAVNIWCPKYDAFTTRDLSFIARAAFLQSKQQDEKYGTFMERMEEKKAQGDELWAYICVSPIEPYVNWQIQSDGTETVISIWQLKEFDATGILYWAVNYWREAYWYQGAPWVHGSCGDGFLIYSGYGFDLPYPIASIRLEGIRDGIEDYQMLCMLEKIAGREAVDDMISRVTTSVLTYTDDDDYLHAVRVLLGDTLEAALNGK